MGYAANTIEKEIEQAKAYYNGQLDKLNVSGVIQVKLSSVDEQTKWLSFNKESIECIVDYLNKLKDKL